MSGNGDLVNRWIMVQRTAQRLLGEHSQPNTFEGHPYYPTMLHIRCVDGFKVSVQAGVYSYSTPNDTFFPPFTHVECGYPTQPVQEWKDYAESVLEDTGIYAYVPVELVEQVLLQHGGILDFSNDEGVEQLTKKRLFMVRNKRKGAVVKDPDTGQPLYFSNKMEAKQQRDAVGGEAVVSLGPDHWRVMDEQTI